MENHLWSEALRRGRPLMRPEVAEEVLRSGCRCLRLGRRMRLVNGPLAGCVGILLPQPGRLHILRHLLTLEEEYVESVH